MEKDARVMRNFQLDKGKELEEPIRAHMAKKKHQEKLLKSIATDERLLLRRLYEANGE